MPRSYWLPVVAVVGLIVAASASPNGHGANAEQAKAQQEITNTFKRIAAGVEDANKPKRETRNCPKGTEDRQSDLCAQWKSADAAKQAADAADRTVKIGWYGIVLAALTFGAAVAAAYFARRAAIATESTVDETRRIGESQTRAYLSCDGATFEVGDSWFVCRPKIKNYGQSPASSVKISATVSSRTEEHSPLVPPKVTIPESEEFGVGCASVPAGGEVNGFLMWNLASLNGQHDAMQSDHALFWIVGSLSWTDVFERGHTLIFNLGPEVIDDDANNSVIRTGSLRSFNKDTQHDQDNG